MKVNNFSKLTGKVLTKIKKKYDQSDPLRLFSREMIFEKIENNQNKEKKNTKQSLMFNQTRNFVTLKAFTSSRVNFNYPKAPIVNKMNQLLCETLIKERNNNNTPNDVEQFLETTKHFSQIKEIPEYDFGTMKIDTKMKRVKSEMNVLFNDKNLFKEDKGKKVGKHYSIHSLFQEEKSLQRSKSVSDHDMAVKMKKINLKINPNVSCFKSELNNFLRKDLTTKKKKHGRPYSSLSLRSIEINSSRLSKTTKDSSINGNLSSSLIGLTPSCLGSKELSYSFSQYDLKHFLRTSLKQKEKINHKVSSLKAKLDLKSM